ncbi:CTBP-interacting protein [Glossina fuscipes fuscipes]
MVCSICGKLLNSDDSDDCITTFLDELKLHYNAIKKKLQEKDFEIQRLNELIENVNKEKCFENVNKKARPSFESLKQDSEADASNDMSLSEEESVNCANLNVALNSEQLFENSLLSPTQSEVISTRTKLISKYNEENESRRCLKDKNTKVPSRQNHVWYSKAQSSFTGKSWASKFVNPPKTSPRKLNLKEAIAQKGAVGKLSLSHRKIKPNSSKLKQTTIESLNVKKKKSAQDVNDACAAVYKSPKIMPCPYGREGQHVININSHNDHNKSKNMSYAVDSPIKEIVFDFSPTKKADHPVNSSNLSKKSISKQLQFTPDCNEKSTESGASSNVPSLFASNKPDDTCSVIMLTPAMQDVIFIDDESTDLAADINTLGLLPDLSQNITNCLTPLRECENRNTQKCQNREKATVMPIKKEVMKFRQDKQIFSEEANVPTNPIYYDDEDEDDDFMPRPIMIKKEPDEDLSYKKSGLKELNGVDCKTCKQYLRACGDRLTNQEIKKYLSKCSIHNQLVVTHNTPEDFWNPHIISFKENDPRNEILIDTRFKDKKRPF